MIHNFLSDTKNSYNSNWSSKILFCVYSVKRIKKTICVNSVHYRKYIRSDGIQHKTSNIPEDWNEFDMALANSSSKCHLLISIGSFC